jgi:hypothetical protein
MNVQAVCQNPHGRPVQVLLTSQGDASEECFLKALLDTLDPGTEVKQIVITVMATPSQGFSLSWRKAQPYE